MTYGSLHDLRPERVKLPCQPLPVPDPDGKAQIQIIQFRDFLVSSACAHLLKPTKLRVDRPPARPLGPAPPLSMRAHVAPKRLRRIHTARCLRALRLSLPLAYRCSPGRAGDALLSVPVPARLPATKPHARTGFSALP